MALLILNIWIAITWLYMKFVGYIGIHKTQKILVWSLCLFMCDLYPFLPSWDSRKKQFFFLCFQVSADLDNCYSTSVSPSLVHMHYLFDRVVQKTLIFCLYLQCFSLLSLASVRGHNYISTKANHKATHSQGSL